MLSKKSTPIFHLPNSELKRKRKKWKSPEERYLGAKNMLVKIDEKFSYAKAHEK